MLQYIIIHIHPRKKEILHRIKLKVYKYELFQRSSIIFNSIIILYCMMIIYVLPNTCIMTISMLHVI